MKVILALVIAALLVAAPPAVAQPAAPAANAVNARDQPADPPTLDETLKTGRIKVYPIPLAPFWIAFWAALAGSAAVLIVFSRRRRTWAGLAIFGGLACVWSVALSAIGGAFAQYPGSPFRLGGLIFSVGAWAAVWATFAVFTLVIGRIFKTPLTWIGQRPKTVLTVSLVAMTALWFWAELRAESNRQEAGCWEARTNEWVRGRTLSQGEDCTRTSPFIAYSPF